mmetsp:Transcript_25726/g.60026  ORF Transcript_25726/g.60026 Transcript_25726/m.60026 type:complete len:324 (-) Transcript_25726:152-1123(-)
MAEHSHRSRRRTPQMLLRRFLSFAGAAVLLWDLAAPPAAWIATSGAPRCTNKCSPSSFFFCGRKVRGSDKSLILRNSAEIDDPSGIVTVVKGSEGTADYRRFFTTSTGEEVSPWHDLPLYAGPDSKAGLVYMVAEIPKMTKPKMECATDEPGNPIKQDTKKGKLRDYHGPIFWNYGFLPRTWEDPKKEDEELKVSGDNDPVDVVEIGSRAMEQGEIAKVKVLGALAMIDDGELDWKVIAISVDDPLAEEIKDVFDIDDKMPGVVSGIREWFRWYKTPDGKPVNAFGFDGKPLGVPETLEVIEETHGQYNALLSKADSDGLWTP